jgi:hypothetical protein
MAARTLGEGRTLREAGTILGRESGAHTEGDDESDSDHVP